MILFLNLVNRTHEYQNGSGYPGTVRFSQSRLREIVQLDKANELYIYRRFLDIFLKLLIMAVKFLPRDKSTQRTMFFKR